MLLVKAASFGQNNTSFCIVAAPSESVPSLSADGTQCDAHAVMWVSAPAQRLTLQAACPDGFLLAGHTQWLGIAIKPLHDALGAMRLQLYAKPGPYTRSSSSYSVLEDALPAGSIELVPHTDACITSLSFKTNDQPSPSTEQAVPSASSGGQPEGTPAPTDRASSQLQAAVNAPTAASGADASHCATRGDQASSSTSSGGSLRWVKVTRGGVDVSDQGSPGSPPVPVSEPLLVWLPVTVSPWQALPLHVRPFKSGQALPEQHTPGTVAPARMSPSASWLQQVILGSPNPRLNLNAAVVLSHEKKIKYVHETIA